MSWRAPHLLWLLTLVPLLGAGLWWAVIQRRRAPVLGGRFHRPPAEAGELSLQKRHLGAVRRQGVRGLRGGGRPLVVAHAHLGHGQVRVDGRLARRQLARADELVARVAEQTDLQRRQPPVEDAYRLPVLGRAGRREPRRRAGDPVPHTPSHDDRQQELAP